MISFQNIYALFLILLIPAFFILRKIGIFKKITFKAVLADWNGGSFVWKGKIHRFFSVFSKIAVTLGFFLAVLALADPVISEQKKVYTTLGTDVIFVVDTSPSMAAKDVSVQNDISRLDASKNAIFSILGETESGRFGMVALGSNASVVVPVTTDFSFFYEQVENLVIGNLGNGSAIGDGICTAIYHLISSNAPRKCIILLTDGENNAGEIHPETAAKLAAENNISLYVVGIGSKGTVPLEYTEPVTGKKYSGYLDSNFDSASLKKIAEIGGGRYFESKTIEELKEVLQNVTKIESVAQNFIYEVTTIKLYKKILTVVLIIFILVVFIKMVVLKEFVCIKYKKKLIFKGVLISFSFLWLMMAKMDICFGTKLEAVQKTGDCVSMVFDISNSMMAKDCQENTSRLQAACVYAKKLLSKMNGTPTSVVLAKGDGVLAIPATQDFLIIESLLDVMSPSLMTVPGTSLGKGILKAKESFSREKFAGQIWLFTDCEETDGELKKSLEICAKEGISVTIIGFGGTENTKTLAGDGKTVVETSLREKETQLLITSITEKMKILKTKTKLAYVNSNEKGSALKILDNLKSAEKESFVTTYETKPIIRYKFFILLAIITFCLSFILTEMEFKKNENNMNKNKKSTPPKTKTTGQSKKAPPKTTAFLILLMVFVVFSGCKSDTMNILKGTTYYQQKKFQKSISCFTKVSENNEEKSINSDYATYNLGAAYSMIGEDDIALENFLKITQDSPENVKYSSYYNAGIIYYKYGDFENASEYFKKAIQTDNTKIDAKINLEISRQMIQAKVHQNSSKAIPAGETQKKNDDLEEQIFNHIKEKEQKQWKNSEVNQNQDLSADY